MASSNQAINFTFFKKPGQREQDPGFLLYLREVKRLSPRQTHIRG